MGEYEAKKCGFNFEVVGESKGETSSEDTQNICTRDGNVGH